MSITDEQAQRVLGRDATKAFPAPTDPCRRRAWIRDKPRPCGVSAWCTVAARGVGDALVASRPEFLHELTAGWDEPRPYSAARIRAACSASSVGSAIVRAWKRRPSPA